MRLKYLLPLLLAASPSAIYAQQYVNHYCASVKQQHHLTAANRGTVADLREDNYDVRYVKLDLALTNQDGSISGNATTRAVATASLNEYVFELTSDLTVDSVKVSGISRAFAHTGDVCSVALPSALPVNAAFEAQVFYHGTIVSGTAFMDRGLRNVLSGASNRRFTFTLGEAYSVKDWWPCKQSLQDKIDSSDVWITVEDTLKAGSNGMLQQVVNMGGTKRRYEWKNSYPIDYYLISASVGPYSEYSYYMHFDNSTDSMLIQNYLYPNALAQRKAVLDSTALMINYFSGVFGRYPFWKEKYGHCQAPLSGGEEHQTMTTIGVWDNEVVPHELAHQWFGDHVTCATWKDIWLNEGFASYAEYLFVQHFEGAAAATDKMQGVHINAMYDGFGPIDATGSVYVDDTTDEERIFSSRLSYNKASSIIHTLRFEANSDALFFNLLRAYQQQFANSTATTEQFKNLVAQQYGRNMDTFFNQWIYSSGWPVYNATWKQAGNRAYIHLDQQTTGNYTAHKYSTPLEIKFSGPQGDTTIRVVTNDGATNFSFGWSKPVTGVVIDPNDWLLDTPGIISIDNTLGVATVAKNTVQVFPNPVHDFLTVNGISDGELQITDIAGRLLLSQQVSNNEQIDLRNLVSGIYLFRVSLNGVINAQGKIVKE